MRFTKLASAYWVPGDRERREIGPGGTMKCAYVCFSRRIFPHQKDDSRNSYYGYVCFFRAFPGLFDIGG